MKIVLAVLGVSAVFCAGGYVGNVTAEPPVSHVQQYEPVSMCPIPAGTSVPEMVNLSHCEMIAFRTFPTEADILCAAQHGVSIYDENWNNHYDPADCPNVKE